MSMEERLAALGLTIPAVPVPVAAYLPAVLVDAYVYTSGQLPFLAGELQFKGQLGKDLDVSAGYQAARLCALNCLAAIKSVTGNLEWIERVVKVTGFVNSAPGFHEQPAVVNGASELLVELFGDAGRHTRSAVGVSELPLGAAVEVEMLCKINQKLVTICAK